MVPCMLHACLLDRKYHCLKILSILLLHSTLSFYSCDLNLKDKEGCTPLHIAVKRNCPQAIKILVANGANTSFKDSSGKTALQHSMKKVYLKQIYKI